MAATFIVYLLIFIQLAPFLSFRFPKLAIHPQSPKSNVFGRLWIKFIKICEYCRKMKFWVKAMIFEISGDFSPLCAIWKTFDLAAYRLPVPPSNGQGSATCRQTIRKFSSIIVNNKFYRWKSSMPFSSDFNFQTSNFFKLKYGFEKNYIFKLF